jgi:endonuclease YncB( thermonuclease family)
VRSRGALRGLAHALRRATFALCLGAACAAGTPANESFDASAVHLRDGDSLIVRTGDVQRELRIAEIDTPERGQPWGKRAKQALAQLVEGRTLRVEVIDRDRYGRDVARLWVGDMCVACELVRGGHAWAYRDYLRDPELLRFEREARNARRGLWSLPASKQVPPWEWRRGVRVASGALPGPSVLVVPDSSRAGAGLACGAKRSCGEMASCAEATFYLQRCGLTRLDSNGDGIPCEAICP